MAVCPLTQRDRISPHSTRTNVIPAQVLGQRAYNVSRKDGIQDKYTFQQSSQSVDGPDVTPSVML